MCREMDDKLCTCYAPPRQSSCLMSLLAYNASNDAEKRISSKLYNVSKNRNQRLPDGNIVFNLVKSECLYDL